MDDDAIEIPANDPLEAAIQVRKEIFDLRRGYRRNLWRCVAEAYAVAFAMASNRKAWKELLAEDFWHHYRKKRPSVKSTEKALLHVMVFVFDATSKNRYDRAWKYAKALEKHFNDKVPPEHIEEVIEENSGLEKMMRAARPYVRRVLVARPRGKQGSGVALDRPEPSPKLSEGGP